MKLSQGHDWVAIRDLHAAELVSVPFNNDTTAHNEEPLPPPSYLRAESILPTTETSLSELQQRDQEWTIELAIGFTALTPKPQLFSGQIELVFTNPGSVVTNTSEDTAGDRNIQHLPHPPWPSPSILPEQNMDLHPSRPGRKGEMYNSLDEFTATTTIAWKCVVVFLCLWVVYLCSQCTYRHYCLRYRPIPEISQPTTDHIVPSECSRYPLTAYQSSSSI